MLSGDFDLPTQLIDLNTTEQVVDEVDRAARISLLLEKEKVDVDSLSAEELKSKLIKFSPEEVRQKINSLTKKEQVVDKQSELVNFLRSMGLTDSQAEVVGQHLWEREAVENYRDLRSLSSGGMELALEMVKS